jgi:GNAT superfamily N-acetyltransferase
VNLRELTDANRAELLALRVAPGQERFVGSVAGALEDAAAYPLANPWYRGVYAGEEPVGFVMLSWDCVPRPPEIIGPWFLWKLLIDEGHQHHGYGRDVVRLVADLVRSGGAEELLTSHVPDLEGGPGPFYERRRGRRDHSQTRPPKSMTPRRCTGWSDQRTPTRPGIASKPPVIRWRSG